MNDAATDGAHPMDAASNAAAAAAAAVLNAAVSSAEQSLHLNEADFHGAATAMPHDMSVHSASSSIRDEQPQDLHIPGRGSFSDYG